MSDNRSPFTPYDAEPTPRIFHTDGLNTAPAVYGNDGKVIKKAGNYIRVMIGPIGSGKSVAMCQEIMIQAINQWENPVDNTRRSKILIVRDTYKNLQDTTLQTWLTWFPVGIGVRYKRTPPIEITYDFDIDVKDELTGETRRSHVHLELKFIALDQPDSVEDLKSLEVSGAFVNECQAIRRSHIIFLISRVGRYPGGNLDPEKKTKSYVIMDTNPPNIGNWVQQFCDKVHPMGWKFYKQPPALFYNEKENGLIDYFPNAGQRPGIPPAENISHLPEGFAYYMKLVETATEEYIKVFYCNEWGDTSGGSPVYKSYKDATHYRDFEGVINPNLPLILGFDYGLTPAVVIGQYTGYGQLNVLEEILGNDIGTPRFMDNFVLPRLQSHYGYGSGTRILAVGDPAGDYRNDSNESCAADVVRRKGIAVVPCYTNILGPRHDSVRLLLSRHSDGKRADLVVYKNCPMLREGFLGNYKYLKVKNSEANQLRSLPDKNDYSHPHDALQYMAHYCLNPHLYNNPNLFSSAQGNDSQQPKLVFKHANDSFF